MFKKGNLKMKKQPNKEKQPIRILLVRVYMVVFCFYVFHAIIKG